MAINMNTTRRSVLAGLGVMPVAGAVEAGSGWQDPILPLYRQWCEARQVWFALSDLEGNEDWDHPTSEAADERESAAFFAMIEMTPISPEGIAALAHVLWATKGPDSAFGSENWKAECKWPGNKLIRGIWRAASGFNGLPPHPAEGVQA